MSERPTAPAGAARRVVLDANVLVPNALRDILLRAAEAGLYEVRWSATTLDELERTLLNRILAARPDRAARVGYLLAAMRAAFPLATVAEDAAVIARLTNDPKDRHVLAAAVQSGARTIVTNNLRDFPPAALRPYRVAVGTPDRFLQALFRRQPARLIALLVAQGADLRQPRSPEAILETLAQHAPGFARAVRAAIADG
jgi:predicted nucleic acid-binding protein